MSQAFKSFVNGLMPLSDQKLNAICRYWKYEELPKDGYFIRAGSLCTRVAFVEEGVLRTAMITEKKEEITCSFIVKNKLITDIEAYLNQAPATSNYIAVSNCRLLVMDYRNEQKLIEEVPEWLAIREKIIVHMMGYFLDIHAMQVHRDAKDRYRNFIEKYPEVLHASPLSHIASFLGIAQPSLSRIRKEL